LAPNPDGSAPPVDTLSPPSFGDIFMPSTFGVSFMESTFGLSFMLSTFGDSFMESTFGLSSSIFASRARRLCPRDFFGPGIKICAIGGQTGEMCLTTYQCANVEGKRGRSAYVQDLMGRNSNLVVQPCSRLISTVSCLG
jgi:hypothetical protein